MFCLMYDDGIIIRQSKSKWMRIEFETFLVGPHKTSAAAWIVETTMRQSYERNLVIEKT